MELQGTQGADTLTGGAENDTLYGYAGNDVLKGGAGDDVLAGNEGADTLQGGDGDDYLLGGPGNDTIDGGAGGDWAAYEDATEAVKVDLNITIAQNTGGGGTDKLIGIEHVYGSAFNDTLIGNADANMMVGGEGNDVVSGGKGDDTLWGSAGNDTLDGGDGDDYMVGGAGDDIVKGGAGWDWSSYEDAAAGVTVDLNKTTAQNTGGGGTDTLSGVEHLYGTKFNDTLTGDAKDNYLWGDAGDDKLYGGAGDDHLSGGAGVNVIDGGDGFDTVDYAFSDKGVTINLSGAPAPQIPISDGVDTIVSIEAAMGSAYADYIVGNDAENYLFGDAGDDVIFGIGGHDTLDGGEGNDILRGSYRKPGDLLLGGAGNDQIIVWTGAGSEGDATTVDGGSGVDTLIFSSITDITLDLKNTGDQLIAPGVHMIVSNIENLMGSYGNDRLTGDSGNNLIVGQAGDDLLDGGAGFDIASYEGDKSVRVDLSKTGPQNTGGAGVDTLSNFEGLRGSLTNDILIGDTKDNSIEGGMGNDILDGGAGADTAIFWGNANQYTWTLNANGTWTVKGLDGADTLLNIETLKFNDKSVTLTPSTTTVTVDDVSGQKLVIASSATGDLRDAVLSPDGTTAYVSDKDGYVSAIDTTTGQVKAHIKVGTELGGMDVSKDGRSLVVAERSVADVIGANDTYKGTVKVHVVDLTTGNVKDYATAANGSERGFYDAAFMGDGKIAVSQTSAAFSRSMVSLDASTGQFTQIPVIPASGAVLSVSDDKSKILGAEIHNSDASLFVVTADKGMTAAHEDYADGVMGFNIGIQAISGNGGRIAQYVQGKIHIYDGDLKYQNALVTSDPQDSAVVGIDFSADGQHLFVLNYVGSYLYQYSASTFQLENVFSLGVDLNRIDLSYGDSMTLSNDGQHLIVLTSTNLYSINLKNLTPDGGTDGADMLTGTAGVDKLAGYGGDDILTGGKGADILTGGKGIDTFVFNTGDTTWSETSDVGVDVITDWEAGDKLSFGPYGTGFTWGRISMYTWREALQDAVAHLGATEQTYSMYEVGGDVYVFYAPRGAESGIQNVVKLANTTAAYNVIDYTSFIPDLGVTREGDGSANAMTGTSLRDFLDGKGGDDVINGGRGNDTLTGGAGADVFKFVAGDGLFNPKLQDFDTVTDFGAGDKLAFSGAPAIVKGSDILHFVAFMNPDGTISESSRLTIDAYDTAYKAGGYSEKYLIVGAGSDTYVVADTDGVRGYDQVVLLKNVVSSLVTADMFMAL